MNQRTCPARPSELGITIAGDSWWEGQRETIDLIVQGFWQHKFVFAQIPTGGGKTIVATAVQRIMDAQALSLTHTIQLQEQYQRTMPWAVIAKGRRNYPCDRDDDDELVQMLGKMNADQCATMGGCINGDGCGYGDALREAAACPQVVMNYAYALRILQANLIGSEENPFRRRLLICDEGHLVEGAVVGAAAISLWRGPCNDAGLTAWPDDTNPYLWIAWATDNTAAALLYLQGAREALKAERDTEAKLECHKLVDRAAILVSNLGTLRRLDATDWIISPGDVETEIRPLWAAAVAQTRLWMHFERVLIMSGTMPPAEILCGQLDIPKEQAYVIDVSSTFPKENRPIYYWPVIKVNRNTDEGGWNLMASALLHIAEMPRLAKAKAIIHTASYKVVKELLPHLCHDSRFLYMTSGRNKAEVLRMLADPRIDTGLFILSPSLTTGVDIPALTWQAVVKVPFGNLGDPVTRARREYQSPTDDKFGKKVYDEEAIMTVVQAAGRAVRSPTDSGVTYILDENFWGLYVRTHSPEFFSEALQWLK